MAEAAAKKPSRPSSDPFFTPKVVLDGLHDAEQRELSCVRAMSFGRRGAEIGALASADIRAKYERRRAEHRRAWSLDGEPVSAHDAAILRGPCPTCGHRACERECVPVELEEAA